eukprot:4674782-Prorocentrum_lima.AAC.1
MDVNLPDIAVTEDEDKRVKIEAVLEQLGLRPSPQRLKTRCGMMSLQVLIRACLTEAEDICEAGKRRLSVAFCNWDRLDLASAASLDGEPLRDFL